MYVRSRQPRSSWRTTTTLAAAAAAALALSSCVGGVERGGGPQVEGGSLAEAVSLEGASYTVGGKDFDEQLVLCEVAVAALQSTGADVTNQCNVGGTEATRNALLAGDIDMYWEYTGTAWVTFFGEQPIQDREEQFRVVKERDAQQNQLVWLEPPTRFNNTYAFAVAETKAAELGIENLSDMAAFYNSGQRGTTCVESEYLNRDDGLVGMQQTYGFQLPQDQLRVLDTGAVYQATADPNQCLFGEVFTTDGRIPALNLRVLADDKTYHPLYNASISIKQAAFDQNPEIAKVFEPIASALTDEVMLSLNARKSDEGIPERQVARDWLAEQGFIAGSS